MLVTEDGTQPDYEFKDLHTRFPEEPDAMPRNPGDRMICSDSAKQVPSHPQ
jgi:hypothetical protein